MASMISRLSQTGLAMALAACELVSFNALEGTVSFFSTDGDDDAGNDDKAADVDEEEQELSWLKDAGCSKIASSFEGGDEDVPDDLIQDATMTLTKKQTAAVVRRIWSLKEIRRQKSLHSQASVCSHDDESPDNSRDSQRLAPGSPRSDRSVSDTAVIDRKSTTDHTPLKRHSSHPIRPDQVTSKEPIHVHPTNGDPSQDDSNPYRQILSAGAAPDGLPDMTSDDYERGLTHVEDLSCGDRDQLRKLAHIELADIFDTHKIRYSRRKQKRFKKNRGIFGVPLKVLLERDQKKQPLSKLRIPVFYEQLIAHLKNYSGEKGLLRIPGLNAGVKSLRQEIDEKFMEGNFVWESVEPHDGAGLLKQFIRDLPQPLLTIEHLDAFVKVHELPDVCDQVWALNLLILILPDVHRDSLQLLLSFLHELVGCEANSMDLHSIGTVMAPNLFYMLSGSKSKVARDIDIQILLQCITLVKIMIKYHRTLWTVPSSLHTQLQGINEMQEMKRRSTSVSTLWYA